MVSRLKKTTSLNRPDYIVEDVDLLNKYSSANRIKWPMSPIFNMYKQSNQPEKNISIIWDGKN